MYADEQYYMENYPDGVLGSTDVAKYLEKASTRIDILTFNRIKAIGFDSLTDFQKSTVQDVCCQFAEFIKENEDFIDAPFASYSINGVSMTFDKSKIKVINGVTITAELYSILEQSGLCMRRA